MSNYEATSKGLFKDGKSIVPEFGNKEQIEAVRKFEKIMEDLQGDGLECQPTYEFKLKIKCICGNKFTFTEDINEGDDVGDFEPFNRATCYDCKSQYTVIKSRQYHGEFSLCLIKKGEEIEQ